MSNQRCFTPNHLMASGFEYTGESDNARCNSCGLEVSNWTADMKPYEMHKKEKPECSFIKAISLHLIYFGNSNAEMPFDVCESNLLMEVRKRGFSNWSTELRGQMIEAGFFSCDVRDRVICIYCNLICQQWVAYSDVPFQVHSTLSPNCSYVKSKLIFKSTERAISTDESQILLKSNEVVLTSAYHPIYSSLPKRYESFNNWPSENSASIEDLVQAGFFYSGKRSTVICFYCGGALRNWGANDNPMIEHSRFFPSCAYAKQFCGESMYRKIQEFKKVLEDRSWKNPSRQERIQALQGKEDGRTVKIPDEKAFDSLVEARLALPISQGMVDRNFKAAIVKRCWENQLLLRGEDYASDYDLYLACLILKKQIDRIDGNQDNICVPSIKMRQLREVTVPEAPQLPNESNQCVLCLAKERSIACIPCGHLITCVACGHSLRSCPMCRREIKAFVKIYV